jgi:hypothetical protein
MNGCISDAPQLRDYRPDQFLINLLWATRGERQTFFFGPRDNQKIIQTLIWDPNATIAVVSGAWMVPLFHSNRDFSEIRAQAATLQQRELAFLDKLRHPSVKAKVSVWNMAEYLEDPMTRLQSVLDDLTGRDPRRLTEVPDMREMKGFGRFLQGLRNQGMKPVVTGDVPVDPNEDDPRDIPVTKPVALK